MGLLAAAQVAAVANVRAVVTGAVSRAAALNGQAAALVAMNGAVAVRQLAVARPAVLPTIWMMTSPSEAPFG